MTYKASWWMPLHRLGVGPATLALVALVVAAIGDQSLYEILGVSEDASQADIKKAFKRKALEWHPDKNKDPNAEERFREIAGAYEVLSDPTRRSEYDGRHGGGGHFDFDFGGFQFKDPHDIFKDFFGGEDPFQMFDKMFEGFDDIGKGLFEEVETTQQNFGFGSFSSFSFSSFSNGDGVKTSSRRVETVLTPDGKQVTRTWESGPTKSVGAPEVPPAAECGGRCAASDDGGVGREAKCAGGAMSGFEPDDRRVDHVAGSACCNPSPWPEPTDQRGCCRRCAGNAQCQVFVWQPSSGSCWLLRWKQGAPRSTVNAADRVMGDLGSAGPPGSSTRY
eukprot:CAMPEP_0117577318 /NCGR_PEP_ID=MMETSP0784-20121206/63353_1 /TAXON_ID=39447 /ORGANISM="" /LENGTH=333 /DNA_ID=CAMNT_0005376801 /DNA_START=24 /DNA_END=1025 /DNA_ORIENTATION=-